MSLPTSDSTPEEIVQYISTITSPQQLDGVLNKAPSSFATHLNFIHTVLCSSSPSTTVVEGLLHHLIDQCIIKSRLTSVFRFILLTFKMFADNDVDFSSSYSHFLTTFNIPSPPPLSSHLHSEDTLLAPSEILFMDIYDECVDQRENDFIEECLADFVFEPLVKCKRYSDAMNIDSKYNCSGRFINNIEELLKRLQNNAFSEFDIGVMTSLVLLYEFKFNLNSSNYNELNHIRVMGAEYLKQCRKSDLIEQFENELPTQ
ncbi:hypothetical protein P9112_014094 [Eukaryota sp. TZLM1-RC]